MHSLTLPPEATKTATVQSGQAVIPIQSSHRHHPNHVGELSRGPIRVMNMYLLLSSHSHPLWMRCTLQHGGNRGEGEVVSGNFAKVGPSESYGCNTGLGALFSPLNS